MGRLHARVHCTEPQEQSLARQGLLYDFAHHAPFSTGSRGLNLRLHGFHYEAHFFGGRLLAGGGRVIGDGLGYEGPQACFPLNGSNVCYSYTSYFDGSDGGFKPAPLPAQGAFAQLDPQIGWEVQKFIIAWTLAYIPADQQANWVDMMTMYKIGPNTAPAFNNRNGNTAAPNAQTIITAAIANAGWRDNSAAPTVVSPATENWLAPNSADTAPARVGSTAIPPAIAFVDTNPNEAMTPNSGTNTPNTPPKPVSTSTSRTAAAMTAPIAPRGRISSARYDFSSRRLTCAAIMNPAAFAPKTQPKYKAGTL